MSLAELALRVADHADVPRIAALIAASVRGLQPEYTASQQEAALRTVFTVDSRLIEDRTYFVAETGEQLVGCGGWSFRKTLYGGDHQVADAYSHHIGDSVLDPATDAAKIRAIFVHPDYARMGLGGLLLQTAEDAAFASGFVRLEMGSTLAGTGLYTRRGYRKLESIVVPVGGGEAITVVRMVKLLERSVSLDDLEQEQDQHDGEYKAKTAAAVVAKARTHAKAAKAEEQN